MKLLISVGLILVACVCVGCREGWQAATYPARGMVTVNGTAANGAVVTLYPIGGKVDVRNSRPWAIADQEGRFELQTYEAGDGAPIGEYNVTVTWPLDVTKMDLAMIDQLDSQFARPEQSLWKVEIEEGENSLPTIAIDGVKLQTKVQNAKSRRIPRGPEMEPGQ